MKWFVIKGQFMAEDIDDAFAKLSEHFGAFARGNYTAVTFKDAGTSFDVEPLDADDVYDRDAWRRG